MELDQLLSESDTELRQALGLLQSFRPAIEDVVETDDARKVTVAFRPDNTLERIEVAADWEKAIQPSQLATVISELLGNAQARVLGFDLEQLAALEDDAEEADVDPVAVQESRDRLLRDAENDLLASRSDEEMRRRADAIPAELDALLAEADAAIAKLDKIAANGPEDPADHQASDDRGVLVTSDNQMVSLRVVGGFIAEVALKESWLAKRSGIALTECFNEIIDRLPEVLAAQDETGA